jgi:hypothetical protein
MEMVRLANIVPGIFRKALQDVEIKGTHHEMHAHGWHLLFSYCKKKNDVFEELISVLCFCGVCTQHRLYDSGGMGRHGVPTGSALKPRHL